jgi:acyl-CoA synthetase (AMP-forming)/AMP-acid ligase II
LAFGFRPSHHRFDCVDRYSAFKEDRRNLEAGRSGVLWVRGPSVFAGYWNRPEATAEVRDAQWYCTRDVLERDAEGWWRYRGRRDEMFKVAGQWVSPNEIEQIAAAQIGVADAAAAGIEGEDGLPRVALFVVLADDAPAEEVVLAGLVAAMEILPRFKRPTRTLVIESIPRTATGKPRRFLLAAQAPAA